MDITPAFRLSGRQGVICLAVALAACGGSGPSDSSGENEPTTTSQRATAQTADDGTRAILESIYFNERTPDGFYSEPEPDPGVFESISHIKNVDIAAPSSLTPETPRYELCADGFDQALQWSIAAGAHDGNLVDNREAELFFEFTRVPAGTPQQRNLQRVFKCAMVDRSDIDLNQADDFLGLYTEWPQSGVSIKLLIEYLWRFSDANNYGHAVLDSTTTEADSHYAHTLEQARLTPAEMLKSECDRVDVYATRYRVDKLTGSITVSETHLQSISSRYVSGQISVCGG